MFPCLPIPLFIEDINRINTNNGNFEYKKLYGQNIYNIMCYGRLRFGDVPDSYVVDDGTASITVIYRQHERTSIVKSEIVKLNNHIKFIKEANKRYPSTSRLSDAYFEDMDKILTIIKRNPIFNSDKNTLAYGSKVIVIGKPYHNRNNRIVVYANAIYPDNRVNRDFEIYFKRHLIELYQNIYYKYTLDGELIVDKDADDEENNKL